MNDVRKQLHATLAIRIARAVDHVVGVALERRNLTLEQARPRLTRQPMGLTDRLLLDGRPLVDIGPLQFDWSEGGLCCNVTVPTKETPL